MNSDLAPIRAAQVLVTRGIDDDVIVAYLEQTWKLDEADAASAVSVARSLACRRAGTGHAEHTLAQTARAR